MIAVMTAICLTALVAMAAIALDGGMLLLQRRQAQAAADGAARWGHRPVRELADECRQGSLGNRG
jgi:uncharacterized membrane protein